VALLRAKVVACWQQEGVGAHRRLEGAWHLVEVVACRQQVGVASHRRLQAAWRLVEVVACRLAVGEASRHLGVAGYRQKVVLHQVAVVCSDQAAALQQNLLLKQPRMPKLVLTIS